MDSDRLRLSCDFWPGRGSPRLHMPDCRRSSAPRCMAATAAPPWCTVVTPAPWVTEREREWAMSVWHCTYAVSSLI
jgi:hypothetical protein